MNTTSSSIVTATNSSINEKYILIEYVYVNQDIDYKIHNDAIHVVNITKFKPKLNNNNYHILSSPIVILQSISPPY